VRLGQILFSQGFGSRRECLALLQCGAVEVEGRRCEDGDQDFETAGLVLRIQGQDWPYHDRALLMMNKPAGHECSRQPQRHPSVLGLLPAALRRRGVQPVGRLDQDTTGLLLLTDDGPLLHRLSSPRHHVAKVYEVETRHPVDASQCERLLAGVVLHDDPEPVRARDCRPTGERSLQLTLTDGRYHQVKRMLAAVGNRVEALHRSAYGDWSLPTDLAPGQWRWLD
jgi:16S rRNA pseudouridine516 synthase